MLVKYIKIYGSEESQAKTTKSCGLRIFRNDSTESGKEEDDLFFI